MSYSNQKQTCRIPEGEYEVEIYDFAPFTSPPREESASKGKDGYKVTITILEGPYAGEYEDMILWLSTRALKYTRPWLESVGLSTPSDLRPKLLNGVRARIRLHYEPSTTGGSSRYAHFDMLEVHNPRW